jgi:surface protein
MEGMFCKNSKLTNLEKLTGWDVSNVTSFNFMFSDSSNITDTSAIKDWNIRRDATFEHMFHNGVVPPEFTNVTGTWNRGTFTPD